MDILNTTTLAVLLSLRERYRQDAVKAHYSRWARPLEIDYSVPASKDTQQLIIQFTNELELAIDNNEVSRIAVHRERIMLPPSSSKITISWRDIALDVQSILPPEWHWMHDSAPRNRYHSERVRENTRELLSCAIALGIFSILCVWF
jgi:hypothetical protein